MDNAQKAIMIGVGLFITIIIISAVLLIVNLGTGLVDDATSNLSSISSTLQNQILQNYDNKIISGTQVRSALQQYMTSDDVSIVLANRNGAVAGVGNKDLHSSAITLTPGSASIADADYSSATDAGNMTMATFTSVDRNADTFVNASARYESFIIYTATSNEMVGIVFIPQGATYLPSGTTTSNELPVVTTTP